MRRFGLAVYELGFIVDVDDGLALEVVVVEVVVEVLGIDDDLVCDPRIAVLVQAAWHCLLGLSVKHETVVVGVDGFESAVCRVKVGWQHAAADALAEGAAHKAASRAELEAKLADPVAIRDIFEAIAAAMDADVAAGAVNDEVVV